MRVADLMSSPVVSLLSDQTLPHARELMQFKHVRHLPVVDGSEHLVGLVSHRDLLRWADIAAELTRERRDTLRIEQIMTRDVWSVRPEMLAATVGHVMLDRQYGCAPVVDEWNRLLGIVTASDFLRLAVDALDAPPLARIMNQRLA
jgi:CBS-domain-containing membrane protein